jgi:predicted DNA-binding transcriptional regulator AlpA
MENYEPELVSVKTLSRMIDVSQKTIWDWLYKDRKAPSMDPLPYHKLGGLVRFNVKEIRGWYNRRRVRPTTIDADCRAA